MFFPLNRHVLLVIITKDAPLFNKKTFCSPYALKNKTSHTHFYL
ncbi:hypothetical protein BCW_4140 [Bacillus cereus W]|uniref:Uncharacterized protein n=2 Tax=Bacillus cereus TaxID=1396 RepID=A0A158RIU6_BACC3|nr:hypothetical protein BCAH820_4257 [Bacillus cereus AH820]ACO26976.1 hypothetical protein BCA_4346 [Bacillus cereus 03BB102]ACQ50451.1 hypothetical protein BAA_4477 [Bacillus anthracis str. A0248]AEW57332.1 Hypothetical protein bcf_21055 [Bacillus cereus F837/76]EDT65043.1 hypothetical protein BAO_4444 [Bacillus anthracis str. A0174]EDX56486.1 hypothetical protein BCW_4140 [Bacillus cereus W]EDX61572.1 hypothetical protein BC03BB108_4162 [Bacillus cereus 03BB108]EDX66244.1 hypothetical pro